MNCQTLSAHTQWHCTPAGANAILAHAPITLGDDGLQASFYILEPAPGQFFLTDAHASIEHAITHGAKITPTRLQQIAATPGARHASISQDGEITAQGSAAKLRPALWDALRLSIAISNQESAWQPQTRQERFTQQLASALKSQLPLGAVVNKPKLHGISGHAIEFPLGIVLAQGIRAVQPIGASEQHRLDWGYIYQSYGKLMDLKKASAKDFGNRIVVIEASAAQDELGRASTVLSEAAPVILYSGSSPMLAAQLLAA